MNWEGDEPFYVTIDDPIVTNPDPVCSSGGNVSISNLPTGLDDVVWNISTNLSFGDSEDGTSIDIEPSSNGLAWVEPILIMLDEDENSHELYCEKTILWAGLPPAPTNIWFLPSSPCRYEYTLASASVTYPTESGAHYYWRNTHTYIDQNANGSQVSFYTLGPLGYTTNVYVKGTNACGSSSEYYELLTVRNCTAIPPAYLPVVRLLPVIHINKAIEAENTDRSSSLVHTMYTVSISSG